MKLNAKSAYQLLIDGVIQESNDFNKPENRWIKHCIFAGVAAGRIARRLGLDGDFAEACGYLHDVGRKISHPAHVVEGYRYLKSRGYDEMARYCITHSFVDNDVRLTAGGPLRTDTEALVAPYLETHPATIYDNIVQLCDLFCLDSGFTTVEKRLLDISVRKGVYSNSYEHFCSVLNLKSKIEKQMGCSLYSLFPEISSVDLSNVFSDYQKLESLLNQSPVKKK